MLWIHAIWVFIKFELLYPCIYLESLQLIVGSRLDFRPTSGQLHSWYCCYKHCCMLLQFCVPMVKLPYWPKLFLNLKSCAFSFIFLIKAYHCTRTSLLLTKRKLLRKWTIFRSLIICWMLKKNFSHSPVSKRENTCIITIYGVHQSRPIFKEIPNSSLIMVV